MSRYIDESWMNEMIASDSMATAKMTATTCLKGAMESASPEVRSFFFDCLQQAVQDQQRISNLMVKKGWYKAYEDPLQVVTSDLSKAEQVLGSSQSWKSSNWQTGSVQGSSWPGVQSSSWQGNTRQSSTWQGV